MMSSLSRGGAGAPRSPSPRSAAGSSARADGGGGRGAPEAPAWEDLYRSAPDVSTTPASALLKSLARGRRALLERSWVAGEAGALARGAAPMPKLSLAAGREGVALQWSESRFAPATRCLLHSCSCALESAVLRLESASGPLMLQPPDGEQFAAWVLGLNAAFHAASCARAAEEGAEGGWEVGLAELDQAAIGLPWHPAVFLAARGAPQGGVLGAAAAAAAPLGGGGLYDDAL